MKQKKIYLIRHGQTDYNKRGMVQGSGIDAPLNEEGYRQAERFWQAYKDFPFDKVYTSALQRTQQSVQKFIDAGIPHVVFEGLNEIHWGHKEGKPFTREEHDHYLNVVKAWQQGELHVLIEGGESPMDVQKRQQVVLQYLLEEEEGERILICMHGRAMRILLCYMLNYPLQNMDYFEHDNLCLYELSWTGSMFVVQRFNDRRHLQPAQNI
ncbi:histidine phosphatase family protein [Cesiribacter andamanensis]|uniref:Alpha-ribazole phosphatase n=1 Tax=Cesiribacter andamanensis AMV16 TaxID=1279009 RepID=M7N6S6_9BACT|nr:histidine phosphatase family protein [Cesiribacter andamanensis]EMR02936.1 Alpha-ribazole phosphatase [Cesiribacter andamanensis AMV16]